MATRETARIAPPYCIACDATEKKDCCRPQGEACELDKLYRYMAAQAGIKPKAEG